MMSSLQHIPEDLPPIVLKTLAGSYSLVNFPANAPIPSWANQVGKDELVSLTRSPYGFSIICPDSWVPGTLEKVDCVAGWRVFRVEAPRDWAMHGLYSRLAQPLSDDAISIYIVGAYNSDHVLVRGQDYARATQILSRFCDIV